VFGHFRSHLRSAPEQFPEISRLDWSRGPANACGHTFKLHFNCRSEAVPMIRSGDGGMPFSNSASGWNQVFRMKIRVGFEMIYNFPQPTPLITVLGHAFQPGVRHHRAGSPDHHPFRTHHALSRRLRQLM
jgi:hypothetical protein